MRCFLQQDCLTVSRSCSVAKSCPTLYGMQHARLPCLSLSPWVCSHYCPLSQWCYPTISSSVIPFSSCLQSFPASGSFPVNWLCISWPKDWNFSFNISHSNSKASVLRFSTFFVVQLSHLYMTTEKYHSYDYTNLCWKLINELVNVNIRI